ncbi:MAG: non-hydrolyzing UDP-N-acetylglucosamine 2-epimerase [Gaiellaceae bacterium]
MTRRRVVSVVGTRPNLMKIAPLARALERRADEFEHLLVHTGQHYDRAMSQVFFDELGIGDPDYTLDVGSGSHAQQIARVVSRLEPVLVDARPDLVVVPGDVNSTLAAALTAATMSIPIAHVEAGLRSFDRTMPEETNRILVDRLSRFLFTHSPEARANLVAEGCDPANVHEVGNTMIDSLVALKDAIAHEAAPARHGVDRGGYLVVTLHRPALVDDPQLLSGTIAALGEIADELPVLFPVHPRTRAALALVEAPIAPHLRLLEPLGYLEFLGLVADARAVLTDSGGIQEETTYLDVPCFTLRDNTERPITVEHGTNVLLGLDPARILEIPTLLAAPRQAARVLAGWDGHASERIADVLGAEVPVGTDRASAAL